jgi:hypothetical protein
MVEARVALPEFGLGSRELSQIRERDLRSAGYLTQGEVARGVPVIGHPEPDASLGYVEVSGVRANDLVARLVLLDGRDHLCGAASTFVNFSLKDGAVRGGAHGVVVGSKCDRNRLK